MSLFSGWFPGQIADPSGRRSSSGDLRERDYQQAQDEVRRLRARVEQLEQELSASQADAHRGREMVADWLAQRVFGTPIYGSGAPQLPAEAPDAELLAAATERRRSARQIARDMERKFFEQMEARGAPAPTSMTSASD